MDDADMAEANRESEEQLAVKHWEQRRRIWEHAGSPTHCINDFCGEPIEQNRREILAIRCFECQVQFERQGLRH